METKRYRGFLTLIEREYYRFARLSRQTIAPPVISTLLFILIFGISLSSRIREVEGFSYIIFILPGLAAMGNVTNSYANTSTSLFMARMDRSIDNMLAAPLSPIQIVMGFVVGGLIRGVIISTVTILVSMAAMKMPLKHPVWALLILSLTSIIFSSLGIISALWSENWDQISTFTNFLITPFVYLGGVFYSIQMLPPSWRNLSFLNPIFYIVDAFRWTVLDHSDLSFKISLPVICAVALLSFGLCLWLFRKGYKLIL